MSAHSYACALTDSQQSLYASLDFKEVFRTDFNDFLFWSLQSVEAHMSFHFSFWICLLNSKNAWLHRCQNSLYIISCCVRVLFKFIVRLTLYRSIWSKGSWNTWLAVDKNANLCEPCFLGFFLTVLCFNTCSFFLPLPLSQPLCPCDLSSPVFIAILYCSQYSKCSDLGLLMSRCWT